MLEEKL